MSCEDRNRRHLTVWLITCLPVGTPCSAAQGYPGIIHLHTQFSDGVLTPLQVAEAAKVAEDRRTVAWVEGAQMTLRGVSDFFGRKLIVFRDGKVVRTVQATQETPGLVWDLWDFRENGQQVVIGVGPFERGVRWLELRNIASGKTLAVCSAEGPWDPMPPAWVMDLVSIMGE